ncbi:DUF3861 domain-containing protein [Labrys monachus]|uniref:DUF3861 domain-containing protein n=1 Tax=Labrys monachus TaxID=217067 RepID=A0ABU0FGN6_9HYPH|nr:DUF3861 domain-containing protein [Labrys monachus]MDQ0393774.1 hypothetical protein [Labrys monachus]
MQHTYRVTVQSLSAEDTVSEAGLTFDVTNHDEILGLVDRVAARQVLPKDEVAEFTIGLKLFSEVMLRHRREPLFAEFFPHFGAFMKRLKGGSEGGPPS